MFDPAHLKVKRSASSVEGSAAAAAVDRENPWPGLASFTEDARGFFFGREKETEELSRLVRRQTLTVLFGQSGLGKSSLLQAGLFPILREGDHLPLYLRLDHAASTPSLADQVKAALTAVFAAEKADAPAFSTGETLWEYFHRKDIDIWSAKNRLLIPVLAFDQFEEIFTLGRADDACSARSRAFLAELTCLVENRPPAAVQEKLDRGELDPARFNFTKPSCQVILSLREDFLPDLEGLKHEMPALIHNRLRLKKLNGLQALEVVARPAPHLLAPGVAEKIVEFVAGARGGSAERLAELDVEPPLLSVICRELNDRRRALGQAQITADLVSGNRREILHDFYERSVADLPAGMRTFIEDHLLTKSGFRDNLALETTLEFPGVTRPLLDTLVARRLLRIEDRLGVQRVELTHDVLAEVIRASRDARQQRHILAETGRRARRLRWLVAGLAAMVLALCAGGLYGLHLRRLEFKRMSRTDVGIASRYLDEGKIADGLAYLLRAAQKDPENSTIAPRLASILTSHNFLLPEGAPLKFPARVIRVQYSADGSKITVFCEDGTIGIIDAATGGLKTTKLPAGFPGYWFLTGERQIAVRCLDGVIRIVDADTGGMVREFRFDKNVLFAWGVNKADPIIFVLLEDQSIVVCQTSTGRTHALMQRSAKTKINCSPDGRWFTSGENPIRELQLRNAATGEKLQAFSFPDEIKSWVFSPDGRQMIVIYPANAREVVWRMYSIPDGQPLTEPRIVENALIDETSDALFSDDGRLFLIRASGGLQVFDSSTRIQVGANMAVPATGTNFSPDGRRLFTGEGGNGRLWDVVTGKQASPLMVHGGVMRNVSFSPDSRVLLTASADGFTRLWEVATGRLLAEPTLQVRDSQTALAPEGTRLAIGSANGTVYRLRVGQGAARELLLPRGNELFPVPFVPGDTARLLWLSRDRARVLDVASGSFTAGGFAFPESFVGFGPGQSRVAVRPDLGVMVLRTAAGRWEAWKLGSNGVSHATPLDTDLPSQASIAFSDTGDLASLTFTQSVRVLNLQTGLPAGPEIVSDVPIVTGSVRFDPSGHRITAGTVLGVSKVWDFATGKALVELKPMRDVNARSFRFSPDGTRIATSNSWGEAQIWDSAAGRPLSPILYHSASVEVADFSPDGKLLLTYSVDRTARLWDGQTGAPFGEPMMHENVVRAARFSPDGTRVVTADNSGAVRVWDTRTSLPLSEPMLHGFRVASAEFSPDGRFVRTSAADNKLHLWSVPPALPANTRVPGWLLDLATLCASKTVNAEGQFVDAAEAVAKIDGIRRTLVALPDNAPYVEWGRWFLSDNPARSIAPGFTITPADAEKLAKEMAPPTQSAPTPAVTPVTPPAN